MNKPPYLDDGFEEGFLLTPEKLTDLLTVIKKYYSSNNISEKLDIIVEYTNQNSKKTTEICNFNKLDDLTKDKNSFKKRIKEIRFITTSSDPAKHLKCSITYGSKDPFAIDNKRNIYRISIDVEGSNTQWVSQLLREVSDEISRSVINKALSHVVDFFKAYTYRILAFTFAVYIISALIFGIKTENIDSEPKDIDTKVEELNKLHSNAGEVSNQEEKINHLFKESVLEYEISQLEENKPTVRREVYRRGLLQVTVFLVIAVFLWIALAFLMPIENFMWGDYVAYYKAVNNAKTFILGTVVICILINIATTVF